MKKLTAILTIALCMIASIPYSGMAQEKLEDPDGGNGPKQVFCVKSPKLKFGYSSSGPLVSVEVGFGEKTACKAAFEAACNKTKCN